MQSDNIQQLLQRDMEMLIEHRSGDRFSKRVLTQLAAKSRMRTGVITMAGGIGAAFAAAQFSGSVKVISPLLQTASATAPTTGVTPELLAALMIGGAILMTAFILRQEI